MGRELGTVIPFRDSPKETKKEQSEVGTNPEKLVSWGPEEETTGRDH